MTSAGAILDRRDVLCRIGQAAPAIGDGLHVAFQPGILRDDPAAVVSLSPNSAITPPTLTKGTQGSTGLSVQDLKDAGRTQVNYYASSAASGTTGTETLITLTKASGTSATTTGTSLTPSSGKTFRITSIVFSSQGHATATTQVTTFSFRINTAGACVVTSTPIVYQVKTQTPATSLAFDRFAMPISDGWEIAGNGTLTFCISANAVFVTNAPTWNVTITGYEY